MRFEGEDGYCVIPTCDYKIEQRLSFNNEDIVEIIDRIKCMTVIMNG